MIQKGFINQLTGLMVLSLLASCGSGAEEDPVRIMATTSCGDVEILSRPIATVNFTLTTNTNFRQEPCASAPKIQENPVPAGTQVTLLDTTVGNYAISSGFTWWHVELETYHGWMALGQGPLSNLAAADPSDIVTTEYCQNVAISLRIVAVQQYALPKAMYVRQGPCTSAPKVQEDTLPAQSVVTILNGVDANYAEVEGYIWWMVELA